MPAVHHIALKAREPEVVAAFYRDVLGLPEADRHYDERGLRSVWLDADGVILMVERATVEALAPEPFEVDRPGLHVLALRIEASEHVRWQAELERHGVAVVHRTAHSLYARDPEGNRVALSSWPEPGEPG